jgi:Outer membrane protein beta-barrel domain
MKQFAVAFFGCFLCVGAVTAHAQVEPTGYRSQLSLSAGGFGSIFQPDYAGNGFPETSPNRLFGYGVYVDVKFTRWVQLEGEMRWMRQNSYLDITQDNYLIGPRLPIHQFHFLHATPYGKALVGMGKMTFEYNSAYGRFTDVALGGGVDLPISKHIVVRPFDFEYQLWPNWINGTLKPYGASAGVAYKLF